MSVVTVAVGRCSGVGLCLGLFQHRARGGRRGGASVQGCEAVTPGALFESHLFQQRPEDCVVREAEGGLQRLLGEGEQLIDARAEVRLHLWVEVGMEV